MPKPPDKHVMERLAFIRYMYDLGVEQAAKPEPHSWTAVLTFQDAVELFLGLAASHLEADPRRDTTFLAYWKLIDEKIENGRLPYSGKMGKLNDARVAFKHHGNPPSPNTIEQCRRDVDAFFEVATPIIFGSTFDSINLIDIVPCKRIIPYLLLADKQASAGEIKLAMGWLLIGFEELILHYTSPGQSVIGSLSFGGNVASMAVPHDTGNDEVETVLDGLVESVGELQEAMQIVSLGINYADYSRLYVTAPKIRREEEGRFYMYPRTRDASLTPSDYAWARNFVIGSAFTASRADGLLQAITGMKRVRLLSHSRRDRLLLEAPDFRSPDAT